jgi:hypothetical protein
MATADCCDLFIAPDLSLGLVNQGKEQGFNR